MHPPQFFKRSIRPNGLPALLALVCLDGLLVLDFLFSAAANYPYAQVAARAAMYAAGTWVASRPLPDVRAAEIPTRVPRPGWAAWTTGIALLFMAIVSTAWVLSLRPVRWPPLSSEEAFGTGMFTRNTVAGSGIAGEAGILAAIVVAMALPAGAYTAISALAARTVEAARARWAWSALALLLLAAGLAATGHPALTRNGAITDLALVAGISLASRVDPPRRRPPPSRRRTRAFGRSALAVALLTILAAGWSMAEYQVASWSTRSKRRGGWIAIESVSRPLRDATVAMEDGGFRSHRGFDLAALHRALRTDLRAGRIVQGGSTITQQLAKNLFLESDRTAWRKLKEAFLTLALERRLTKSEILEAYVNTIDYGQGRRGLLAASRGYFRKAPSRLTLSESAVLVGLVPFAPQGPLRFDRLESGRRVALSRIAFFFPHGYSETERERAAAIPLARLIYPFKNAWDRRATEDAPPVWHGVATFFDLAPQAPSSLRMMHASLKDSLEGFLVEAHARLGLVGIDHIGVYNDRAQRGTVSTLSAHAFGQAIDLSGFRFRDGAHIRVEEHRAPSAAARLGPLEAMLRRHFDTVVGWREDPKRHDNHFHSEVKGPRAFPVRPSEDSP